MPSSSRGSPSGLKAGNVDGPKIGRNVRVGTGAKIIGPVRIGDGASIGANAVVVDDVAEDTTVAGVPARVLAPRPCRHRRTARRSMTAGAAPAEGADRAGGGLG